MTDPSSIDRTSWTHRVRRWAQVNLTETDAKTFDVPKWVDHWLELHTEGIIVNAGGIVAYYPTEVPGHPRARHLGERDLFGEICEAARANGIEVLARMDSSRGTPALYEEHPDWFACTADGEPYRTTTHYLTCVNGPYFKKHIPAILREICERYQPAGFTDNSWSGLGRKNICHCRHCREKFARDGHGSLPLRPDFGDAQYRKWMRWSYVCRLENWDLFNQVTHEAGGEECHWVGMVHADPLSSHVNFCDLPAVGERTPILLSDQQSRIRQTGFEQNSLNGCLLHEVSSWDTPLTESMAMYVRGERTFRLSATPAAEARQWMWEGIAGGIRPWWHVVNAFPYEKRRLASARPVVRWHKKHQDYLLDREPIAEVGLLWSHDNIDFYGRDEASIRTGLPWQGWMRALIRARIPFLPVNARQLPEKTARFKVLILPDLAAVTDVEAETLRAFVDNGGSLVATGKSAALDADGLPRPNPPLDDLLGIAHRTGSADVSQREGQNWEYPEGHSYLRLPDDPSQRHPVLRGLEATDVVAFGGALERWDLRGDALPVATLIPDFPLYPPEFAWIPEEDPHTAAIIANEHESGGRVVAFAADIDRCYARRRLPDHGTLLANAVHWAHGGQQPFEVHGPGCIDVRLYRQDTRLVLHLVNNSNAQAWPDYLEEVIPLNNLQLRLRADLTEGISAAHAATLEQDLQLTDEGEWRRLTLPELQAHEMIVLK